MKQLNFKFESDITRKRRKEMQIEALKKEAYEAKENVAAKEVSFPR